jgi:hypothetical protein
MVPIEFKRAKRPHQKPQHQTSMLYIHQGEIQQQQQPPYQNLPRYDNYMSSKQAKQQINLSSHHIHLPPSHPLTAVGHQFQQSSRVVAPSNYTNLDDLYQKSNTRGNYDYMSAAAAHKNNKVSIDMEYSLSYANKCDNDNGDASANYSGGRYNNGGATVWRGSACNCINIATCSRENLSEFLHSKDCVFFVHQQQQHRQQQQQRRMVGGQANNTHRMNNYYMMMNEEPNYIKLKSFSHSDYNLTRGNVKLV